MRTEISVDRAFTFSRTVLLIAAIAGASTVVRAQDRAPLEIELREVDGACRVLVAGVDLTPPSPEGEWVVPGSPLHRRLVAEAALEGAPVSSRAVRVRASPDLIFARGPAILAALALEDVRICRIEFAGRLEPRPADRPTTRPAGVRIVIAWDAGRGEASYEVDGVRAESVPDLERSLRSHAREPADVVAPSDVPYRYVVAVLDACRRAGIEDVRFPR